jgi:hypothetical protein
MRTRLPSTQAIWQVYAVIAVMFSAWTIPAYLWKLSAWMLILNMGELVTVFAYSMVANLIESLVILLMLLGLCALLPASVLRDDFVVRGSILAVGLIGALMAFVEFQMQLGIERGPLLLLGPLLMLGLMGLLLFFAPRAHVLRSLVGWISDRLTVFLYLLAPLYVVFLVYVLVRTLV